MKGEVNLNETKLSPTDKAQLQEIKELYDEGAGYFKDSKSYMVWHFVFYVAAIICLLKDLSLPGAFAMAVAIYAMVQHMRYSAKAKKIALKIMALEDEIFGRAMIEAVKAFKEYMEHDTQTKPRVARKRRATDSDSDNRAGNIRLRKSGKRSDNPDPDNPGWYRPESKK